MGFFFYGADSLVVCAALSQLFQHRQIGGMDIYVVDDHHKVLAAWAIQRRKLEKAPNLITIDHHTDVYEAFLREAHWLTSETDANEDEREKIRNELLSHLNWGDDQSLLAAIDLLCHDEHIDAATRSGVLASAFSIQLSDGGGTQSIEQERFQREIMAAHNSGAPIPKKPTKQMTYARAENMALCSRRPVRLPGYAQHIA